MVGKIGYSLIIILGLMAGAWIAVDGLSPRAGLIPMVLAEADQPTQQAGQPEVTERGLPGTPRPGIQAIPPRAPMVQPQPKLPASPVKSPDQEAREALERLAATTQAAQQPRPSIRELLEILRALPGGAQVIEDAKRRGARISSKATQPRASLSSWLNPFELPAAEAADAFSLTLSPGHLLEPSREGGHYLSLVGMSISGVVSYNTPGSFKLYNHRHATGSQIVKPYAHVHVSVPRDGWYLINFQLFIWGGMATLKHFVPPDQYPILQTFDYTTRPRGQYSFPALLELSAGGHDFYLAIESGSASFFEASITLL